MAEHSDGLYPHLAFVVDGIAYCAVLPAAPAGGEDQAPRRLQCRCLLREEIGAGPATIEKIQSIMLDGKPVDDIGSAMIHDGSVLALSAAMPGLVGATLRRGGAYASFRSAITYHEPEKLARLARGG